MTDPAYIKDPENFHSDQWDHARIASAVAGMDVELVSGIARAWTELGTTAHDAIVEFSDAIKKTIAESWQGAAASAASGETQRYSSSAAQAQEQLHGVAAALTPLAETVASLRSQVPETIGTGLWDKLTPWDTDTEDEYYRREGEAREKMAAIYNPGLATSDGNVPSFTTPESIVDVRSGQAGPGNGQASGTPSSSDRVGAPSVAQPTSGEAPASDPSAVSAGDGAPAPDDTQPDAATAPSTAATAPASTATASVTGDQTQSRPGLAQGVDSSAGAGSRSAGAGAGAGAGGGAAGGIGVGGLGGGVGAGNRAGSVARPGSTPGAAGVATGGRTGAGMRGTGPMGGGMMGGGGAGAGKGGGEDKEHKTPDYLITLDNGNELIGKLPLVSPPVIGA